MYMKLPVNHYQVCKPKQIHKVYRIRVCKPTRLEGNSVNWCQKEQDSAPGRNNLGRDEEDNPYPWR